MYSALLSSTTVSSINHTTLIVNFVWTFNWQCSYLLVSRQTRICDTAVISLSMICPFRHLGVENMNIAKIALFHRAVYTKRLCICDIPLESFFTRSKKNTDVTSQHTNEKRSAGWTLVITGCKPFFTIFYIHMTHIIVLIDVVQTPSAWYSRLSGLWLVNKASHVMSAMGVLIINYNFKLWTLLPNQHLQIESAILHHALRNNNITSLSIKSQHVTFQTLVITLVLLRLGYGSRRTGRPTCLPAYLPTSLPCTSTASARMIAPNTSLTRLPVYTGCMSRSASSLRSLC